MESVALKFVDQTSITSLALPPVLPESRMVESSSIRAGLGPRGKWMVIEVPTSGFTGKPQVRRRVP